GALIVSNMEASLSVPTATSYRQVPAKLLEVNRKIINGHLGRTGQGKISFTHVIAFALIEALQAVPAMTNTYLEGRDGKPRLVNHEHVGLGLAVDVKKRDGKRTLMVPCVKAADTLSFKQFVDVYNDLVKRTLGSKITPDDFAGTTISLTNVGGIGTLQSVPRLMQGQAAIVGVGAIGYPAEFAGSDPHTLAEIGVSKIITISNTYDHRIVQGAESGMFLRRMHELLLGEDDFYERLFASLGIPYTTVKWRQDDNQHRGDETLLRKQMQVRKLIQMYRVRGHLIADLDPLGLQNRSMPDELDPASYGLTIWDLDREFLTDDLNGPEWMALGDILGVVRDAYSRTIGIEYMHIQAAEEKDWIQSRVEAKKKPFDEDDQRHLLYKLGQAEAFEHFLGKRYVGHKRFGIEGAEGAIPLIDAVLESAADDGQQHVVIGMAHRGRLNVLANIMGQDYEQLFRQFEGFINPETIQGTGDVKYHLGAETVFKARSGNTIPVTLAPNPSHLEAVDPIVIGMVRALQDQTDPPGSFPVLPLLIHGDAAFAGQGVVAETLNTSRIPGFRVGGTVHIVINNQVGYTTSPEQSRSGQYATEVAKMVQAPIFHVNGDDPEAVVRATRWAFDYRQAFHKDVVIDMICYRRQGHNEGDEPSYTQPVMYRRIDDHPGVRSRYVSTLVRRGDITEEQAQAEFKNFEAWMQSILDETRAAAPEHVPQTLLPKKFHETPVVTETGVERAVLDHINHQLYDYPDGFNPHPKLARQFETRRKMYEDDGVVDWGLAETMAYGSLLMEGTQIRISGQDTRRGTFAHRHAVLVDHDDEHEFKPLAGLADDQAQFWIYDSMLSEYAALGFEYGYSLVNRDALVAWEAQFGDFVNGAQIIIDQYLAAAADKWNQLSGLVMLLPHGYEGQGPEHSSARLERFLTLCAEGNMTVANATTSAQFFHLLRHQVLEGNIRPLVVFSPKSLLRSKLARSPIADLERGGWHPVLDDAAIESPGSVKRIALCSGKVAYDAMAHRDSTGAP
ncbi:MAG: multifunctional oxoglutarate decarboxylase/oxoglutarate dehydrogenase thiamine pyrophosphate-binding subunit/dihydrolipoyllysine-residue succinyltransferase subunit, partial [Actinobacteria bacterium]|nr:multifunctional oxoglutarate decarboxylase/oxoglutarate dehydrogenase thiamine pyrophosphate-binding subunit/dihydrolipoyllysine-residue succinyltransferase subunit [Actinomycetota bacterium]